MKKERLDKLNQLIKNSYRIEDDLDSEHGIKIINRLTGRERKIRYNKNQYVVTMTCKVDVKEYSYSLREIQAWIRGENLLDRRMRKDGKATFHTCKKCELDYPSDEMRGKICYLCKEELSKVKYIDRIRMVV